MTDHRDKLQRNIVKNGVITNFTPAYMGTYSAYDDMVSRDYQFSKRLRNDANSMHTDLRTLQSGVITSGSFVHSMTASGVVAVAKGFDNWEFTRPLIVSLNEPSPTERKNELVYLLMKEDKKCADYAEHIEIVWSLLQQKNNKDRYIHIGQSLRQFINKILGHLAPDQKIMSLPDYVSGRVNGKGPSRSQRTRYAIQGSNTIISDANLQIIDGIIKKTSTEFDALSKLAKERNVGDIDAFARRVINDVRAPGCC